MKTSVVKIFAGTGIRLGVLSVLLFFLPGMAGVCHAQAAGGAQPATKPAPAAAAASSAQAAKPAAPGPQKPGGNREGIRVHGHWIIEVRNPDGKLVSHTEFENSLAAGGAGSIANMLLGATVPGGYKVRLASSQVKDIGPCTGTGEENTDTWCVLVGSLVSPVPAAFGDFASGCGGSGFTNGANGYNFQTTATGPCFPLTIGSAGGAGLTFTGTAVASTAVNVTDVFLDPLSCNEPPATSPGISPNSCATGQTPTGTGSLTHATLPTAVTITAAGQSISVNMQLSFQ